MKGIILYGTVVFVLLYLYLHSKNGKRWWNELDTQTQQLFKIWIGFAIAAYVLGLFTIIVFPM